MAYTLPDSSGHFGAYGGRFVPETLVPALEELTRSYLAAREDSAFQKELAELLARYAGRPTPLYHARRLSEKVGGRVWLKREDLCHTGAHKINNTLGQVLLARKMGKRRVIAETGAGQHGVATATACVLFNLSCAVYMGTEDIKRQELNVFRMKLLGAEVIPVDSGSRTLKDALSEALRDWVTNVRTTYYCLGSVAGPHPYPMMVRDFQSVIGREAREQVIQAEGRLPTACLACVGGGSNSLGLFYSFIGDKGVRLIGVEAAGRGLASGQHSATLSAGKPGVLHGAYSYLLDDEAGLIQATHSVAPGLDYPGVGPEHSYLKDAGRAEYVTITDQEALRAFARLSRLEGIIPALESAHAVAYLWKLRLRPEDAVLVNLSGRGDKDVASVAGMGRGGA